MSVVLEATTHWQSWLAETKALRQLSNDLIIAINLDMEVQAINEPAKQYFHCHQSILGKHLTRLNIINDNLTLLIQQAQKIKAGLTEQHDIINFSYQHAEYDTHWKACSLNSSANELFGVLFVGRKQATPNQLENQLETYRNYINAIIDVLPGSIYWKDGNGIYLGCNTVFLDKGNIKNKNDVIGKSDSLLWPAQAETIKLNDNEVMRSNRVLEFEETVVRADGEKMYFASVKSPLKDSTGQVIGIVGNSLDVTKLKDARDKAEIASRAKTQFLAVAGHELRVYLTGIISVASMLTEGIIKNLQEARNYSQLILDSGSYLLANINSILDYAQLEAEKFSLKNTSIDLKSYLSEIIATQTGIAKKKGLSVTITYPDHIPTNIYSDPLALQHIIANLVSNAIRYTETGSITVTVDCLKQSAKTAVFSMTVCDTGIGIPQDKLNTIFDKFSQINRDQTQPHSSPGSGLGLSIVKKFIDLLGGQIQVTSTLGHGSQFTCILEFKLQEEAFRKMPWSTYANTVNILIVSEASCEKQICNYLGESAHHITESEQVLTTLIHAQQLGRPYDIILFNSCLSIPPEQIIQSIIQQPYLKQPMPILLLAPTSAHEITLGEANIANFKSPQTLPNNNHAFFATILHSLPPYAFQFELTEAWEAWLALKRQSSKTKSHRILLIEDDKIVQLVEKNILVEFGYRVDIADTGNAALNMVMNKQDYAMILVDIGLPDISGNDIIKYLRQHFVTTGKSIPIIALTGYISHQEKTIALQAGANEIMEKPVLANTLKEVMHRYLPA